MKPSEQTSQHDLQTVARDKYDGAVSKITSEDRTRLAVGEPLAYIIGWIPFCGARVRLDSKPLIPRTETEWWTERFIEEVRVAPQPLHILDLCAGSGCIGIAVLKALPHAQVTFVEIDPRHADTIRKSLAENAIDASRATILTGDLWDALPVKSQFSAIATNPPYIPAERELATSVINFEPHAALFAGHDGMSIICRIADGTHERLYPGGPIWIECDITNTETTKQLFEAIGATARIVDDQYQLPRIVVASWQ